MAKKQKQEIESYLEDEFNIEIYEDLTNSEQWKGLFDPLEFLNLLYSEFEFFETNVNNYLGITNHFGKLTFKKEKRYYFLWAFNELLDKHFPSNKTENMEGVRFKSLVYLSDLKMKIENELFPKEDNEVSENKFHFDKVKKHLETLHDTKAKIKYLIEIKTDYQQKIDWEFTTGKPFDEKCELEIKKLEELFKLEANTTPNSNSEPQIQKSNFSISETLSKIDYIRIINALSELRCFKKENGTYPSKKEVMQAFGSLVNIDLSNYDKDLNKAFTSSVTVEKNLEIFERLKAKTQDIYLRKLDK